MISYMLFIQNLIGNAPKKHDSRFDPVRYNGNSHLYLGIPTPDKHSIAISFKKKFPDISFEDLIKLLNKLNKGNTFEDKTIGPMILMRYKNHLLSIKPLHIDRWLENLTGWCEIDTLCQSTFPHEFFLENWKIWNKALNDWSIDRNISKCRASLVLLCKSLRSSNDSRLKDRALENIETLKHEKDILITKAISWVLREMTKNFKSDVKMYLDKNEETLPKIAVRETRKKIDSGRKN